jgi:hypothetical protein
MAGQLTSDGPTANRPATPIDHPAGYRFDTAPNIGYD